METRRNKYNKLKLKLKCYKFFFGPVYKCSKCTGYYTKGYVCVCGKDNY